VRCCSPSLRPAAFPPPSPPPICGRLCSRLHRYCAAVRLLTPPATASPPRLPVAARLRHSGLGEVRSPRFRCVPFIRNGVSDHGRAVAPRMTVRNMLPSALSTASASAELSLSRLNIPLHMIAVYASQPPSPATTQHSLEGGSLLPYPHRSFTGWTAPASPGALITDLIENRAVGRGRRHAPSGRTQKRAFVCGVARSAELPAGVIGS
jgi:hypothetical protein